jgi:hypothetical protein
VVQVHLGPPPKHPGQLPDRPLVGHSAVAAKPGGPGTSRCLERGAVGPVSRSPCHLHAFRFVLHMPELQCVTRAKARGRIGGLVGLRQAGAFLLRSKSVRTLSIALASVRE